MSNLLTLLQPKDYVSKIKLYCRYSNSNITVFKLDEQKPHNKRIKIEPYENI